MISNILCAPSRPMAIPQSKSLCSDTLAEVRRGEVQDDSQIPRKSPIHITLSAAEAAELNRRAAKYMLPYFEVVRARVTLVAASGMANNEIAPCLSTRRVGADRKLTHGDKHRWPPKPA